MSVLFWILISENIVYIGSQAIGRGLKQWPLIGCSDSILLELAWFHIKAMQSPEFALGRANWGVRVENGFTIPNSWTYEHKNKTMVKFAQKKSKADISFMSEHAFRCHLSETGPQVYSWLWHFWPALALFFGLSTKARKLYMCLPILTQFLQFEH